MMANNVAGGAVALVTGASSGIGRSCALALASAGFRVAVHGRRVDAIASVCDEIGSDRVAGSFIADLSEQGAADRLAASAMDALPAIDALVAVAGADVLTGPAAAWPFGRKLAELVQVDLVSTMLLSRRLGRTMADRHAAGGPVGGIVTIGWDQAATGMEGDSGELFAAVKGGVMAFTRSLARSLAPGVRVNCVAPGWIRTAWGHGASAGWQERARRESLLGRWGTPDDVAAAVTWLLQPASGFVTGQVIDVNGGFRGSAGPLGGSGGRDADRELR
ncbi:MAG: SDR family NAD(P)-dependent oxidoreductase [Planctomycetaceae bacterium]